MNNPITERLHADELIKLALSEDITGEDVTTNAVMPGKKARHGRPHLQAGRRDLRPCGVCAHVHHSGRFHRSRAVRKGRRRGKKGRAYSQSNGRHTRPSLGRTHRAQLSAAHERHSHRHARHGKVARRMQNEAARHPQDHAQHARVRKICRKGGRRVQPPL